MNYFALMTGWLRAQYPTIPNLLKKRHQRKAPTCCNCGASVDWGVVCRDCRFGTLKPRAGNGTGGFVLPATLLVLVLLSMLTIAAMYAGMTEALSGSAMLRSTQAFYAADGAVNVGHAELVAATPTLAPSDSIVGAWTEEAGPAAWRYIITRIDDGTGYGATGMYLVRGEGRVGENYAFSRVGLVVKIGRELAGLQPPGFIWTSGSIMKNGAAGNLSGIESGCNFDSVPGIVTGGGVTTTPGDSLWVSGDPPVVISTDPPITWEEVEAFTPSLIVTPSEGWTWPSAEEFAGSPWPVIYVDGDAALSGSGDSGRGVLIVNGNLTTNGSWSWEGLLLIAGTWTSNGNNTLEGAAIVGLLAGDVDLANGNKSLVYNSCAVTEARLALGPRTVEVLRWFEAF